MPQVIICIFGFGMLGGLGCILDPDDYSIAERVVVLTRWPTVINIQFVRAVKPVQSI